MAERCWECHGTGREDYTERVSYTETEPDFATGGAMGAALGMGYFPSYRTVTKYRDERRTRTCTHCGGSGERR
jgi:hypothetical protein